MKKPIVIVGAGGLGKEIACLIEGISEYQVIGFYDDGIPKDELILGKYPVLGTTSDLKSLNNEQSVVVAFGNPKTRKKVWELLASNEKLSFPVLIHPQALLMNNERITLGRGVVVFPFSILTTDIVLGDNCLVHTLSLIHI